MQLCALILTERLRIRSWNENDALLFKEAVDSSLSHLNRWLPWAKMHPMSISEVKAKLNEFQREFQRKENWLYGVFDRQETKVLGGVGLHAGVGPRALEIGYWLRLSAIGQGFATEAVKAVIEDALGVGDVDRFVIKCDLENLRSIEVPKRLGFHPSSTFLRENRTIIVWEFNKFDTADASKRVPKAT